MGNKDPILVTFCDIEHLLKPEPSHFQIATYQVIILFPLNPESAQPHFSNSIENATPLLIVIPVTKCNFIWQHIPH